MLWQGRPFTGLAYEEDAAGNRIAEVSYLQGQRSGATRHWTPSGLLILEQSFAFDALHGEAREWYDNGACRSVGHFELGICKSQVDYSPSGEVVHEFVLHADSPQTKTLARLRTLASRESP